jgi:opacity protein-like surface antigen
MRNRIMLLLLCAVLAAPFLPRAAAAQASGTASAGGSVSAGGTYQELPFGFGIFGTLIPAHQGKAHYDYSGGGDDDESVKLKPVTGGVGIFGEYKIALPVAIVPYLAVGLEMMFAFPQVDEFGNTDCDDCQRDVFFALNARLRLNVRVHRYVGIYPLFSLGVSNITQRWKHDDADNYTGLDLTLCGGVEFYPVRYLMPFLELRYLFGVGWDKVDTVLGSVDTRIYYHALLINVGLRFL